MLNLVIKNVRRYARRKHINVGTDCVSVDLQTIIELPRIDMENIYLQKSIYHENFVSLKKNHYKVPSGMNLQAGVKRKI